jgi:hypothetical protein
MSLETLTLNNFTGGLDLVTALTALPLDRTPDAINWTIKEDGSIEKIRGWQSYYNAGADIDGLFSFDIDGTYVVNDPVNEPAGTPYASGREREGLVDAPYTMSTNRFVFMNVGTEIRRMDPGPVITVLADDPAYPGTHSEPKPTPVAVDRPTALQFDYFMLFLDHNNEMRSTPGDPDGAGAVDPDYATYEWHPWQGGGTADAPVLRDIAGQSEGPPRGRLLAVWNRTAYMVPKSFPNLLKWSNPGDPFDWPGTNEIEFSSGDTGGEIVAAIPTPGALVVLATDAIYRVYDQISGAYTLLSRDGCTNGESVREVDGLVYYMSRRGVMATDGNSAPQLVSRSVDPLLIGRSTNLDDAVAFKRDGRYYCGFRRSTAGTGLTTPAVSGQNNLTLELMPRIDGAIMVHGLPMSRAIESRVLQGDIWDVFFVDARDESQLMLGFLGGDDDGNAILARYVTAPLDMGTQEFQKRIRRTRLVGRGLIRINDIVDYTGSTQYLISPTGDGAVDTVDGLGDLLLPFGVGGTWDVAQWDVDVWGDWALSEGWSRMNRRGRTHSYVFVSNTLGDSEGRPVLGGTGEPSNGVTIAVVEPHYSVHSIRRRK